MTDYGTGLVRSPILTTLMQVSSRLLLVWPVVNGHPRATAPSPAYSSMLLAWSITEIIRYSYFVTNLRGDVPSFLTWLRYNTFYVLYPVGIASEMFLIFKASEVTQKMWQWMFLAILLAYIPGLPSPILRRCDEFDLSLLTLCRELYIVFAHDCAEKEGDEGKAAREENRSCQLATF